MSARNKIHQVLGRTASGKLDVLYLGQDGEDAIKKYDELERSNKYVERMIFNSIRPNRCQKCAPADEPKRSNPKDA